LRIRDVYPGSFAHPGSQISDPGSRTPDPVSRIPDLGSRIQKEKQKRGVKKSEKNSGGSYKYHKIENYFIFELVKKKIWTNLLRILELFTQKSVNKLSKI
jgi:hypothetical protein